MKKKFPKFTKKIKGFLTDESGKMSKKDALGLAAGSVLLTGLSDVEAGHGSSCGAHTNQSGRSVYASGPHANGYSKGAIANYNKTAGVSVIVNGAYNFSPTGGHVSSSFVGGASSAIMPGGHTNQGHGSAYAHSSHGSHGSHGSRW